MKIKITGQSPKIFQRNLKKALNLATYIASGGAVLSSKFVNENGIWANKYENPNRYDLYMNINDYIAYVKEETSMSIVLDFKYRYDKEDSFGKACIYAILFELKYHAQIVKHD